jgi:hypothetical protein
VQGSLYLISDEAAGSSSSSLCSLI